MVQNNPWTLVNVTLDPSPLFPNPLTCIAEMSAKFASELIVRSPGNDWGQWASGTRDNFLLTMNFDPAMILWATLICVVMTILRSILDRILFTPIAKSYKLSEESIEKFPESIWKCSVYLITWCWSAYITHDMNLMFDLTAQWRTWYPGRSVETSIYWLFTFEVGFYIHYSYGMIFLEARRKDFKVLMLHHILTIALIIGCYSVRFHVTGVFLIFIHDIGDVFLEGSKSILYFKEQDGRPVQWVETVANIGFLLFSTEYFLFRIYWFITKALYSTMFVCLIMFPTGPLYIPFNLLLLALLAMQIFWFTMIVKLLIKVLFLREELADSRDIVKDEDDDVDETTHHSGKTVSKAHKNGREKTTESPQQVNGGSIKTHQKKKDE